MSAFDFVTFAWLFAVVGFSLGVYVQKKMMYDILRIKSIDGTAEHIGNGEFVYIMSADDYCRIVLQIERAEK